MYDYFCPECGNLGRIEGNGNILFQISLVGLFKNIDNDMIHPEYMLLHDDVVLSENPDDYCGEMKLIGDVMRSAAAKKAAASNESASESASGSSDSDSDDDDIYSSYTDIQEQEQDFNVFQTLSSQTGFQSDENAAESEREYMNILKEANPNDLHAFAGYSLDSSDPYSVSCRRWVWTIKFIRKLSKLLEKDNQLMDYLLSAELGETKDPSDISWAELDLKECFSINKMEAVYRKIYEVATNQVHQSLPNWREDIQEVIDMLNCTSKAILHGKTPSIDYQHLTPSVSEINGRKFLTGLVIGQRRVFQRICPFCGAHIAKYLGLYPQKIISLIGKPASGKSNIIGALYAFLNGQGEDTIPGLKCEFETEDPQYAQYTDTLDRIRKKLAEPKTEKNVFPSLTVTMRYGKRAQLYTFLDCPGEFFDAENHIQGMRLANMAHMQAMKHSDAVCIVLDAQQLLPRDTQNLPDHSTAGYDEDPTTFISRIQMFKSTVLDNNETPLFFIVSKADALKPIEGEITDIMQDGSCIHYWCYSVSDPSLRITAEEISDLFSKLNWHTNSFYLKAQEKVDQDENPRSVINMAILHEIQYLTQKFISAIPNANDLIGRLFSTMYPARTDRTWHMVPTFLISPFGFYAVKQIWKVPVEMKLDMIKNHQTVFDKLNEEEKKALAESASESQTSLNADLLNRCGIDAKKFESFLLDHYKKSHITDNRFGANQFMLWLLVYTGLIEAVYQPNDSDNHILTNSEIAIGKFIRQNCSRFGTLRSDDLWTILCGKLTELCETASEKNWIETSQIMDKLSNRITTLDQQYHHTCFLHRSERKEISGRLNHFAERRDKLSKQSAGCKAKIEQGIADLRRNNWETSDFIAALSKLKEENTQIEKDIQELKKDLQS